MQGSIEKYLNVSQKEYVGNIPYDINKYEKLKEDVLYKLGNLARYVRPLMA